VPRLALDLKLQIREFVRIALEYAGAPDPAGAMSNAMRELWVDRARQHGCQLADAQYDEYFAKDIQLNVQGLIAWLGRRHKA
jgi:hypothetical protein